MDKEDPDGDLIRRFLDNDISAFDILYEKYRSRIYAYLGKMLYGQKHLADDIFQQTWLRIIGQLPRYRHNEKFLPWALRISHNLAIDHFRKHKNERIEDFSADSDLLHAIDYPAWRNVDRREMSEAIDSCVNKLPPEQKEVFILRQEDVGFREISEIQQCSVNTALGRMHYALKNLQNCLSKWRTK